MPRDDYNNHVTTHLGTASSSSSSWRRAGTVGCNSRVQRCNRSTLTHAHDAPPQKRVGRASAPVVNDFGFDRRVSYSLIRISHRFCLLCAPSWIGTRAAAVVSLPRHEHEFNNTSVHRGRLEGPSLTSPPPPSPMKSFFKNTNRFPVVRARHHTWRTKNSKENHSKLLRSVPICQWHAFVWELLCFKTRFQNSAARYVNVKKRRRW